MFVYSALYQLLRGLLVPRLSLVPENLALRQQLLVLHRATNQPRLRRRDRLSLSQRQLLNGIGKASSAIGAGSPELAGSDAGRLTKRFAILLEESPERIPSGECRGFKQNFTCLAMRLRNQQSDH
jgi:hypothetical protein